MHVLPQLRRLERKYRDWLVVVGVHSSKFPNERDSGNVCNAVLRYGVEHPVVNDAGFTIWQQYGVRAWPTLIFIDPRGKVFGRHEGEFEFAQMDTLLAEMGREFRVAGQLDETPLPYQLEVEAALARPLSFPGKVEADPAKNRIAIADSGHNRILIADRRGNIERVAGSGAPGLDDGSLAECSFNHPQGMAWDGELLYVADAGNHAVRRVDPGKDIVSTLAGTGVQALYRHEGGDARQHPLNSPYDLAVEDGTLYIAMAGFHQLWALELESGRVGPFAGDGVENILDGPGPDAQLAQPYGIGIHDRLLVFADSETSAVRTVAHGTGTDGGTRVDTLVGTGLFDFGDRDGRLDSALLQHVQGVTSDGKRIFVADTYNHKVKTIALADRSIETLAGAGVRGFVDGAGPGVRFDEPAGLTWLDGYLYVADTNNHAIRVTDPESGETTTLELKGLPDS